MDKNARRHLIDVAAGREPADLCITNSKVIDVFSRSVFDSDVYVAQGYIAGFGGKDFPQAKETFDAGGRYLTPGLIDSHVHIESSHLSPAEFSRQVVPHGTTTVVADPHEICNVCGLDGFDYMLKASEGIALQVFLQFPSCVPCTPYENAGAILKAPEVHARIGLDRVQGLGELMDFYGVCNADEEILDKLMEAWNAGKVIDGHYLGPSGSSLDAYACSGVSTEHECATVQDLQDRLRRGIYVLLRQGTTCHDVLNLVPGVTEGNYRFCLFCTDDRQSRSLVSEGHLDNNLRIAVSGGLDPLTAICMATINAAVCYRLNDRGAIAPGRRADLVLFDDLESFRAHRVWVGGEAVAEEGRYLAADPHVVPEHVHGRMNVKDFRAERLQLFLNTDEVRTIKILPYSVVTETGHARIRRDKEDRWIRDAQDIVKIAVVERHKGTGNIGLGLLENFGLKGGAVATSVAHDSHNIIVAGDNDQDMELAVNCLIEMGGGMVIVKEGRILDSLEHEIAGLMTDRPGSYVAGRLGEMEKIAREELGIHAYADPFMTLCFMALPVIPEIKITDLGLFDVTGFRHVPVEEPQET